MEKRSPAKIRAEAGERRRLKMRAKVIAAAARTIGRMGQDKSTIDDFIREAGVSRGTFYNHFATREELLEVLWASYGHDPFYEIQKMSLTFSDPAEQISVFTRLALHRAREDPTWGWLIIAITANQLNVAARRDMTAYTRPALEAGEAAGTFHFDDTLCAMDVLSGIVESGLRAILEDSREAFYPEALCKMILLSLGMNRSDAHRISHRPLAALS